MKRKTKPVEFKGRIAFAAVPVGDHYGLGVAEENHPGYYAYDPERLRLESWDEAVDLAKRMNDDLGLNDTEAMLIVASSMRSR
jgi:hypothetical protein